VLIEAQDLRAGTVGHLRDASLTVSVIPALCGRRTDAVGACELSLGHPAVVGLKDLKPEGLRGAIAGPDTLEAMAEVATAARAVVLGCLEVEGDQLITLACVLQGALVRRLDSDLRVITVQTARPPLGSGIHRDRIIAINAFDLQLWKA
jgi:hypothetical protein